MSKYNVVKLKNIELKWAQLLEPVDTYMKDGKEFSVDLLLEDSAVEQLISAGLSEEVFNPNTESKQSRFKTDAATGLKIFKLKKRARFDAEGTLQNPALVFMADGRTEVTGAIGNGSIADVDVILSEIRKPQPDGTYKGTGKLKATLGAIRISSLAEYAGATTTAATTIDSSEEDTII